MKKIMEGIENEKNITKDREVENELEQLKNSSLDELENAPEYMEELFAEPPLLDFDSEPTDEDLKLEDYRSYGERSSILGFVFCALSFVSCESSLLTDSIKQRRVLCV